MLEAADILCKFPYLLVLLRISIIRKTGSPGISLALPSVAPFTCWNIDFVRQLGVAHHEMRAQFQAAPPLLPVVFYFLISSDDMNRLSYIVNAFNLINSAVIHTFPGLLSKYPFYVPGKLIKKVCVQQSQFFCIFSLMCFPNCVTSHTYSQHLYSLVLTLFFPSCSV